MGGVHVLAREGKSGVGKKGNMAMVMTDDACGLVSRVRIRGAGTFEYKMARTRIHHATLFP